MQKAPGPRSGRDRLGRSAAQGGQQPLMQATEIAVAHHQHAVAGLRVGGDRDDQCIQPLVQAQARTLLVNTAKAITVDDAVKVIHDATQPWFVYVAFHAAHFPMHTPPAELLKTPLPAKPTEPQLYRAMVEAVAEALSVVIFRSGGGGSKPPMTRRPASPIPTSSSR